MVQESCKYQIQKIRKIVTTIYITFNIILCFSMFELLRHQNSSEATNELYVLACGLDPLVKHYTAWVIEGIHFHTIEREIHKKNSK